MLYAGLDYHKRYSLIQAKDRNGVKVSGLQSFNLR